MSTSLAAKLARKLDRELAWRKRELITNEMDIPSYTSPVLRARLRQAVLLLYAHWEGFTKASFQAYVEAIASAGLDARQLRAELFGLCMHKRLRGVAERRVARELGVTLKSIVDPSLALPRLPTVGVVRTRSNLNSAVLRELLETVGLEPSKYASYEADPINTLVRTRNAIAHGAGLPIPREAYQRMHHAIIQLMSDIRAYLEDSLATSAYIG